MKDEFPGRDEKNREKRNSSERKQKIDRNWQRARRGKHYEFWAWDTEKFKSQTRYLFAKRK